MTNSGVAYFHTNPDGSHQWPSRWSGADVYAIAYDHSPDGTLQVPDEKESSTILPVGTTRAYIYMKNQESTSGDYITLTCVPKEFADTSPGDGSSPPYSSDFLGFINEFESVNAANNINSGTGWVPIGASRNVRIGGDDNDDNGLACWVLGRKVEY